MKIDTSDITFFGDERFSHSSYNQAPIFEALAARRALSALVLKKSPSRSRQERQVAVLGIAKKRGIKTFIVENKEDLCNLQLPSYKLGIVASFGLLLPAEFMQKFSHPLYNLHPSLLPLYRGVSPIEGALLDGVSRTGISLMRLSAEMDAGAIIAQQSLKIEPSDSKLEITQKIAQLGLNILLEYLPLISQKDCRLGQKQGSVVSYTQKIKASLITDFTKKPALYWQRYVRAYQECPNNRFLINELVCEILAAEVLKTSASLPIFYDKKRQRLNVLCQKDYLSIKSLKPASKNQMSAAGFVNGLYKNVARL